MSSPNYPTIEIGRQNIKVTRLGMGCWTMGGHGWGKVNDKESFEAIEKALASGINFYDTADVYGLGRSEELLAKFLGEKRHSVVIATKGGVRIENGTAVRDCSPSYLRQAIEKSLKRLKVDVIPVYYIHWPDDLTPTTSIMETLNQLKDEGKIQAAGLSNFSMDQIKEAFRIGGVDIIQAQWNLLYPNQNKKAALFCEQKGIPFVAWGVLADGLLTGKFTSETKFPEDDHRSRASHFHGGEFRKNINCVREISDLLASENLNVGQAALRWVLDSTNNSCALFGARNEMQVTKNVASLYATIPKKLLEQINSIVSNYDIG